SMLPILPQRPGHPRQGRQQTPIHRRQGLQQLPVLRQGAALGLHPQRQLAHHLLQQGGIEHLRRFAQCPQRTAPHAHPLLHFGQGGHLLQPAQTRHHRREEVEQQQRPILIVEQLSMACPVAGRARRMQPGQQGLEQGQILQPAHRLRCHRDSLSTSHRALSPLQVGTSHCLTLLLARRQESCRTVLNLPSQGGKESEKAVTISTTRQLIPCRCRQFLLSPFRLPVSSPNSRCCCTA